MWWWCGAFSRPRAAFIGVERQWGGQEVRCGEEVRELGGLISRSSAHGGLGAGGSERGGSSSPFAGWAVRHCPPRAKLAFRGGVGRGVVELELGSSVQAGYSTAGTELVRHRTVATRWWCQPRPASASAGAVARQGFERGRGNMAATVARPARVSSTVTLGGEVLATGAVSARERRGRGVWWRGHGVRG